MDKATTDAREYNLDPDSELRFEVDFAATATVKLLNGTAEIFGVELAPGNAYHFTGKKIAVFTWHGCTLELSGECSVEYTANETPMDSYLNLHLALEQMRVIASQQGENGPRVLILGPHDVGKTSLCKILLSYALRQGRRPVHVSLDCSEGSITMPGTITATSITNIIDVEEGFGSTATTAASMGSTIMPLAYYYGYQNPGENLPLYKLLISKLAQGVKARSAMDDEARLGGQIIDTTGLIDQVGYDIIQHAIAQFSVNVVVVLGHERLYSDMIRILRDKPEISVVKVAKSGGVVERDNQFRTQLQRSKIQEYFYGTAKYELSPYSTLTNFSDVSIWRVGESSLAPTSALPIGMDRQMSETQLVKIDNADILLHSILAVLNADEKDTESNALESNVAGFIYISDVDDGKQKLTVLSPAPGKLLKKHLLMGSFKWMET
ncbi:Cleavage polyadenylation factor subunit clp1 [Umbelopsis sp. WA50703]